MKPLIAATLVCALLLSGCNRAQTAIREQQVPKQPQQPVMASAAAADSREIAWTVPRGWAALPAQSMRLASFQVSAEHPEVLVTVVPLAGDGGGLLPNVNRWAGQIGLPATTEQNLAKLVTHTEVVGQKVDFLDMIGPEDSKPRQRMLVAILPHEGKTYYFKLAGLAEIVTAEKPNFDAFIKSINFNGTATPAAPEATAAGRAPALPDGHPALPGGADDQLPAGHPALPAGAAAAMPAQSEEITYSTPQGWVKDEPLPLRIVSFHVGDGEKRADVIVSKLPATGSGTYMDNINRWRGQVNLPPSQQGEQQPVQALFVNGIDSMMFDFVGPGDVQRSKRMLLAWVPKGDDWWFFKIVGPSETVGQQQVNFEGFMKSVKFVPAKP